MSKINRLLGQLDVKKMNQYTLEPIPDEATPAILTGSRAYGTPRDDSDYDLVILARPGSDVHKIAEFADHPPESGDYDPALGGPFRIYCGNGKVVNLIVCCDPRAYAIWRDGTQTLIDRRNERLSPITRDEAIEEFQRRRREVFGEREE